MKPPKLIKPYVLRFCKKIYEHAAPEYIPVQTSVTAVINECIEAVSTHITHHGGKLMLGWAIWEWPKVLIEAEFHAVWQHPEGYLIDLSRRRVDIPRILFFHDPKIQYKGRQIDTIRQPLSKDPNVQRYCELGRLMFQELNTPKFIDFHGDIKRSEVPQLYAYKAEQERLQLKLISKYGANTPEVLKNN